MRIRTIAATLGAFAVALPATAGSITITRIITEGDAIKGVGNAEVPAAVAVNNNGDTLVEVQTDAPDADNDNVVLKNGSLFVREDQPVTDPAGANVSSFGPLSINEDGNVGWNLFLRNLTSTTDSGVFFNTTLIIQESDNSTAAGFSANTPYIGFFKAQINDNNRLMVVASVDDPNIATTVDRALVLVDYDAGANTFTETVLAKEGDILPGQTAAVGDFVTGVHGSDLNNAGQALYVVDTTGDAASDIALYRDTTLLLQEGSPSPIVGRNFNLTTSAVVALNDNGDWAIRTTLTGDATTDNVIVVNGAIMQQEGNIAPGTSDAITGYGSTALMLANDGDPVYFVTLAGDAATNQALYKGNQLLMRKGVTQVDGVTITTISGTVTTGIGEGFAISPDGRYIIVRVVYANGDRGVVLIDTAPPACPADLNGDDTVDVNDLLLLIGAWGSTGPTGDINDDNIVDVNDLLLLIGAWGDC